MGILVKNEFYNLISDFNTPGQFEIQVLEYQQGWFTSNADVQYTIKTNNATDSTISQPFQFVLREKIYHGPIIFLPQDKQQKFHVAQAIFESNIDDKQYPILARTTIQLDGKVTTTLQAEKISNAVEQIEGMSFVFQKIDGKFHITPKQNEAKGRLSLGTVDLLLNKSQLRIKNIELDYKLDKNNSTFWEGKRNITIGNLFIDTPDNEQIILQGFVLDLYNMATNDKMKAGVNIKLNSVHVNGKKYGDQNIELAIDDINLQKLTDIQKHAHSVSQQNIPLPILITQFYQLSMNLLSQGLTIDLNRFDLNTTWGEIHAQINLKLQQSKDILYSPFQLLDKLHTIASLQIPESLFEKIVNDYNESQKTDDNITQSKTAKEQIKEWTDAGWIQPINKNIKIKIKFENRELFINDKLVPTDKASFLSGQLFNDVLAMNILH